MDQPHSMQLCSVWVVCFFYLIMLVCSELCVLYLSCVLQSVALTVQRSFCLHCFILAEDARQFLKCVKSGNLEKVEGLLRAGVDVNCRHPLGWTALHTAAVGGDIR